MLCCIAGLCWLLFVFSWCAVIVCFKCLRGFILVFTRWFGRCCFALFGFAIVVWLFLLFVSFDGCVWIFVVFCGYFDNFIVWFYLCYFL